MKLICVYVVVFHVVPSLKAYDDSETSKRDLNLNVLSHSEGRYTESKWFRSTSPKDCRRSAKCQPLVNITCMGSILPYNYTSLDLIDSSSQEMVQEILRLYQYLRYVPKCWAVLQPFLCALYLPKCENQFVDLPSKEMCHIALKQCQILYQTSIFPNFIKCEDDRLFMSNCRNDVEGMKFNTTGFCMEPLVRTDQPEWFYPGVDNCGMQCKDVLYTDDEHRQIRNLMVYCVTFCIILNSFTVVTFIIDWKNAKRYPALAIFYTNICFLISYCGWLVQFLGSEIRDDIVCKKDGTIRKYEPSANENLSCVLIFVAVYYFFIAGMVWFVIFTYAWHMSSLQALGKVQERVDKKRAYFHLIAWSLPLILTITTMALSEIDGDYVLGICFVGFVEPEARISLLLAPLVVFMFTSGYIVLRGLLLLIKVKVSSGDVMSEHSSKKIRSNIVRMGVFAVFMMVFCIITFAYHIYSFTNSKIWNDSLRNLIFCKLTSLSSDYSHCKQEKRPSVAMLQLQLFAVFGSGFAVASWVWCMATLHVWSRFIKKKLHLKVDEPVKFQKHKIIAQAFEKRKKFNEGHKISIECQQHTDPVGLRFDLNSAASNELSTTWAANLPRFVNRRGAVPNEVVTCSLSSNSEVSYSLQRISIESRRNSGESQVSVQFSEVTAKINSRTRKNRLRRKKNVVRGKYTKGNRKRGSSSSLDSQYGTRLMSLFNNASANKIDFPNLSKRRTGNAGLDELNFENILTKTELNLGNSSDDENLSLTISENKFNVVINNHSNLDLTDQLIVKSLHQDLRIEELNSNESKSSDSESSSIDSFSCPELKQLLQSSINSAVSSTTQNRDSKQSKTSIDIGVQANANDIVTQTNAANKTNTKGNQVINKHKKYRKTKLKQKS